MFKLINITCEHMPEPLAVTAAAPRFSWNLESDEPGVFQSAWRIEVFDENGGLAWDSGKVPGRETLEHAYQGCALRSLTRYRCRVTAWNELGSEASSESFFETGFLDASEWKAKWIEPEALPQPEEDPLAAAEAAFMESLAAMMRGEPMTYLSDDEVLQALPLAPYDPPVRFRKRFTLDVLPARARVYMTAHGIYSLSINGRKVEGTLLAPGFTSYDKRLKYQAYDVTALLQEGENALCIAVADGWFKGKIALGRGCEYGKVPAALFQMELLGANGERERICSDASFTWSYDGPIRYADLYYGQCEDRRRDDGDPSSPSYAADGWKPSFERDYPLQLLDAQIAPPVEVYASVPAQSVFTAPNGDTLVDFGQNMAGILRVQIHENAGEEISFEHGETLDAVGNFVYAFEGQHRWQRDIYISAGKENEVFEPEFTYHGFRYVRVRGGHGWQKEQFTAKAISSANPRVGSFTCSDERLNQLQSNIYWSQRSNTLTIPTDCPTREKAGWTGDVVVYGATALYNQQMTAFFEDWLRSIRLEQDEQGQVLNTVPLIRSYVQQKFTGSLGWGDVILTLPWQLYRLYGDRQALEENYDAMEKWVAAMTRAAAELPPEASEMTGRQLDNQHYLINTGFHFGDWLVPSVKNAQGFSDGPASSFLTMNTVDTALLAADAWLLADISDTLGKTEKAARYRAYGDRVREAFREELCTPDGCLKQEMQGNYILALKYNMAPQRQREQTALLRELIRENGGKPDTGFMSAPHILDVLCDHGERALAWEVLMQEGCPGWMYELEHGATTMWENWDAIKEDGRVDGCSYNHYAYGCVGDFLYRRVLGIQCNGVGCSRVRLEPGYDFPLSWVEGSYQSASGAISLRWEKADDGTICVRGRLPANTSGTLVLPDGSERELSNGAFQFAV